MSGDDHLTLRVPDESDVVMTATAPLRHLCPHRDEVDEGTVTITWRVDGETLELHSLREYLDLWAYIRISHEKLTDDIRHDLRREPGIEVVSVETAWNTAGMEVRCSTSPIPAGQR